MAQAMSSPRRPDNYSDGLVPAVGLEPTTPWGTASKAAAFAGFATQAWCILRAVRAPVNLGDAKPAGTTPVVRQTPKREWLVGF